MRDIALDNKNRLPIKSDIDDVPSNIALCHSDEEPTDIIPATDASPIRKSSFKTGYWLCYLTILINTFALDWGSGSARLA